jgi:hypothetical protein
MRFSNLFLVLVLLAMLIGAGHGQMVVTLPATPPPGGEQGYFLIQSIPTGSDIYFDGIFQGEAPVTVTVSTTGNPSTPSW